MRLVVDGTREVLDCRGIEADTAELVAAIRDPDDDRVACPTPGPAHDHLGWLRPGMHLSRRAAFAAVARSRGETAPQVDDLRTVAAEMRRLETGSTDIATARERVAAAGDERDRLRERVATLRGEVQARREAGLDVSDATDELASVAARLSEVTTEREAAEQALDRARRTARDAYDRRERRLELQDKAANLQREARATLAHRIRPAVDRALDRLGEPTLTAAPDSTVALAAATVAVFDAPVVAELEDPAPDVLASELDVAVLRP